MKEYPESEIQAKFFADAGEKRSENLAKNFADFCPSISRKSDRKNFHKKTSTFSTRDETKFFHREILGGGCPKEKTNKHKHFGRDGARDKHEPSPGQTGPLPGTNWDPSLGQTGLFLFDSTVKSPFCPVCPWDVWGFVLGTIVPQGRSEKCLCVFCLLVFSPPTQRNWNRLNRVSLKTLTSLNKEVRPFFLGDNSIWSFPSVSSLSDYSIWRS